MPDYKLSVVSIHGMGSQGAEPPERSTDRTFSDDLYKRLRRLLGDQMDHVSWREVFWSHVLQSRQETYLSKIRRRTDFASLRRIVMCSLADAAAYHKAPGAEGLTYTLIHDEIDRVLGQARADVGPQGPVLLLAHSLGGHILSNYIYDHQKHERIHGQGRLGSDLENMKTVAGFMTFGCNIPFFLFAFPEDDISPIDPPRAALPEALRFKTWWHNFYDRDDILGYPLRDVAPAYGALVARGELRDRPVNAGLLQSWTPFSHNAYWKDPDFFEPVAGEIRKILKHAD